ncbi:hypothetical protein AS594_00380 [Streptomyces agglomeratus]|uniref:Uncharacterized protein n=1 Tax=Streptomyces agglomeratus TaxID=285458 RepID=A0A1E5P0X7_9ACTN|nr:hypothetical protein AS594_00380 [Streptomyces agglomeratus]
MLAVACSAEVITDAGKLRANVLAKKLPKRAWQQLSAGAGAKGYRATTGPSSTSPRSGPPAISC